MSPLALATANWNRTVEAPKAENFTRHQFQSIDGVATMPRRKKIRSRNAQSRGWTPPILLSTTPSLKSTRMGRVDTGTIVVSFVVDEYSDCIRRKEEMLIQVSIFGGCEPSSVFRDVSKCAKFEGSPSPHMGWLKITESDT